MFKRKKHGVRSLYINSFGELVVEIKNAMYFKKNCSFSVMVGGGYTISGNINRVKKSTVILCDGWKIQKNVKGGEVNE